MVVEAELAKEAAALLAPFLSRLMGTASAGAMKAASKKAGEAAWDRAARLWYKLWPQVEKEPKVAKALQEVAETGDDPQEVEAVISFNLKKIMKDLPPETLAEIQNIFAESNSETRVAASGDRSVAVGGDSTAPIITGDKSSVNPLR